MYELQITIVNLSESLRLPLIEGRKGDQGFWVDSDGKPIHVSASDVERFVYCPMSWRLSQEGVSAKGEEVRRGIEEHEKLHTMIVERNLARERFTKNLVIWSWWFSVVLTLAADTAAFYFVQDGTIDDQIAKSIGGYLVLLALVWLLVAIALLFLPWRTWIGWDEELVDAPKALSEIGDRLHPLSKPWRLSQEGWFTFGRPEALILFAAVALSLHGIALNFADNRSVATFAMLVIALVWTLLANTRLQAALRANQNIEETDEKIGMEGLGDIRYSDGGGALLLEDPESGLRGRPDQITKIGEDMIPVEFKSGRTPKNPHKSHRFQVLAYLQLITAVTGKSPPFGLLRYGSESVHSIEWTMSAKNEMKNMMIDIQRTMVEGGAKRDHERPGKCAHCSRREECPDRLITQAE